MDRLHKKCLIASSLFHGFLFLLLIVGSAFFVAQPKTEDLPTINVVPRRLIDAALAGGGGNPRLAPSDAKQKGETLTPQPPQPTPPPPTPVKPQPREETPPPQPVVQQPKKAEPTPQAKKTEKEPLQLTPVNPKNSNAKPTLDLKPIVRNDTDRAKQRAEAEAHAAADANRRLARALGKATERLREGFANGTAVDVPGPGGEAYANYAAFVREAYDNAWIVSQALADDDATAVVKVVIRRDGRVIEARIVRRSGNSALDKSVQSALDRVKMIAPFPEGARDEQRTFTIDFNLKAKRALG